MLALFNDEYFKYRLIKTNGATYDLQCVDSASIDYDSESALKQSATITITQTHNEVLNIKDKIQIIHVLNGIETPLGTFLMSTPSKQLYDTHKIYTIDCWSTLWLLGINKIDNRYLVPKGTQVVMEIRRIMEVLKYPINITDSTASTNVDIEFVVGTSYLTMINELLKVINYNSLYIDGEGVYTSTPYRDPQVRKPEIIYDEDNVDNIIIPLCTQDIDLFNIPNKFVRYVNNPTVQLRAIYENNNPQSITSTANAPLNVDVEEVTDATDLQTLYDVCKRKCQEVNSTFSIVEIQTAINPIHGNENCIGLKLNTIDSKFIEAQWSIDCSTGGLMNHILKEVVLI